MRLILAIATGWCGLSLMAGFAYVCIRKAFPSYGHNLFSYEKRAKSLALVERHV